jgi:hypothetical protein
MNKTESLVVAWYDLQPAGRRGLGYTGSGWRRGNFFGLGHVPGNTLGIIVALIK